MSIIDEIHPNLKQLSHSSNVLLHKCKKKFQLYKLLPTNRAKDADDEHLIFGTIVGLGIQEILISSNLDKAYWIMFLAWPSMLDADEGESARKTFWHCLYAVEKFLTYRKTVLANYELFYTDGQPAVELGFTIDLGDGFTYRGKVDAVLINKMTNELYALECKTTKNKEVHPAQFRHSGQALGYSLVLDVMEQRLNSELSSALRVKYCIYKTFRYEWEDLPFTKSLTSRAMWIKNLMVDKETVIGHAKDSYWPMHGENCYDFFRPCPFFGVCELSEANIFLTEPEVKVDREEDYPFKFNIVEIIDAQIARQSK